MKTFREFPRDDRFMSPVEETPTPPWLAIAAFLTAISVGAAMGYASAGPWAQLKAALDWQLGVIGP